MLPENRTCVAPDTPGRFCEDRPRFHVIATRDVKNNMPPLQRQPSARRRSLTKTEDAIFAQADSDRDAHLNKEEFAAALRALKDSSTKDIGADMSSFHEFLEACNVDDGMLTEVWDELRNSRGTQNDAGVSLDQWKAAEFFEDDD